MTLDELITKAQSLRNQYGGDILVGTWPYDGQMLWEGYLQERDLTVYDNHEVYFQDESRAIQKKTLPLFLMFEDVS